MPPAMMALSLLSGKLVAASLRSSIDDRSESRGAGALMLQGEIWWADLADPIGSSAGYRRPVIIVQADQLNRSKLSTIICVPITGNTKWAAAPTSLLVKAASTQLDRDSVAQVAKIVVVDKAQFIERIGRVDERTLLKLFDRLDIALGRTRL